MNVSEAIVNHLEGRGWMWGGTLNREINELYGSKHETVGRLCRMLARKGVLEVEYEHVQEGVRPSVRYRLKPENSISTEKPKIADSSVSGNTGRVAHEVFTSGQLKASNSQNSAQSGFLQASLDI